MPTYNLPVDFESRKKGGARWPVECNGAESWMEGVIQGWTVGGCVLVLVAGIGYRTFCPDDVQIEAGGQVRAVQPGEKLPEVPEPHPPEFKHPQAVMNSDIAVSGAIPTTTTLPPATPALSTQTPVVRAEHVEEVGEHAHEEIERPAANGDAVVHDTGTAAFQIQEASFSRTSVCPRRILDRGPKKSRFLLCRTFRSSQSHCSSRRFGGIESLASGECEP